jgi:AhpD family alkylhydroperoxidase
VDQLDEPDDTDHDACGDEVQNQLQHAATLCRLHGLWLTVRMDDAESRGHNHSYGHEVQAELAPISRELRELIPDVYKGFGGLHAAAFRAGALDAKTKELVALAIAVTTHCDGCIAAHAKGAARNGATEAEVAELIGVTISMNGGPATVYGPRAFAAFREFTAG